MEAAPDALAASRELQQRYHDDACDVSPRAAQADAGLIAAARASEPSAGAAPGPAAAAAPLPPPDGEHSDDQMWSDDEDDELEERVWREALAGV